MGTHDHIDKAIAEIEDKIAEHTAQFEQRVLPLRTAVNALYAIKGEPPKYGDAIATDGSPAAGTRSNVTVRPDEFYGKPLATAVTAALTYLRDKNQAPASVDTIYELLMQGGFDFPTKSKEASIQSLSISIGKNSGTFAKVGNGLIGLRDWYPSTPRRTRARSEGQEPDLDQPQDDAIPDNNQGGTE